MRRSRGRARGVGRRDGSEVEAGSGRRGRGRVGRGRVGRRGVVCKEEVDNRLRDAGVVALLTHLHLLLVSAVGTGGKCCS